MVSLPVSVPSSNIDFCIAFECQIGLQIVAPEPVNTDRLKGTLNLMEKMPLWHQIYRRKLMHSFYQISMEVERDANEEIKKSDRKWIINRLKWYWSITFLKRHTF